jgi:hypothetical protein
MAELYTDLDKLANDAKDWKCKLLFNQAVFNQGEEGAEDVDIVDLCEFLPHINVRDRKENQDYPPGTNYMFPERFEGLAGKGLLLVELKLAAIQCGYSLAIRNSNSVTNAKSDRAFYISLSCLHGTMYSKNSSHQKSHQETSVGSKKDGASKMSSKTTGASKMSSKTTSSKKKMSSKTTSSKKKTKTKTKDKHQKTYRQAVSLSFQDQIVPPERIC